MDTRKFATNLGAIAAMLAVPGALLAQDMDAEGYDEDPVDTGAATVDIEGRAGVALPTGDLAAFTDAGVSVGVGGAFWVHDNVALRVDGDFADLNGENAGEGLVTDAPTPDATLLHYGVGVEVDLPGRASMSSWDFEVNAGVGGTTLDTDDFLDEPAEDERQDITKTYPNVNGGITLGRKLSEELVLSLSGQAFYTFVDETDFAPLSELRTAEDLAEGVSVPVTLSLRYDLPGIG